MTMIDEEAFNSLEWQALDTDGLKRQLRGTVTEDVEHMIEWYDEGKPVSCGVLLFIRDQNGRRQIVEIYAPDERPGELDFSRAEYRKEE
jgi:hypothetical protein